MRGQGKPKPDARMAQLVSIAAMQRDLHLSRVASLGASIAATQAAQAALERPPVEGCDPALHAAALRHDIWAEHRRTLLRHTQQRQEAALAEQRAVAARALARHETLRALLKNWQDQPS